MNTVTLPQRQRARLRVEDFALLCAHGAFADAGKTELLDGEIVQMQAQFRPHSRVKSELAFRLRIAVEALHLPLTVLSEASVALPPHDMPEPDIVLTGEADGDGPVPADGVALVIEVADSTLAHDLGAKAALYARHGVPEYWVVDLAGARVYRHCRPEGELWGLRDSLAAGEAWPSLTITGLQVDSAGLK